MDLIGDKLTDDVLSAGDLASWQELGYVVIRNAFEPAHCEAVKKAIWNFLGADPGEPQSWYRPHPEMFDFRIKFFDHPALSATRNSARIRRAYEQLYGSSNVISHIQHVGFSPPESATYAFNGSGLHWDVSLRLPIPLVLQGLLYLTDVDERSGPFCCVPGFHRRIGDWLASLPTGADPRLLAPQQLETVPVTGSAGDFIIWHQALPHCATANRGISPRMVQYHTYLPRKSPDPVPWV